MLWGFPATVPLFSVCFFFGSSCYECLLIFVSSCSSLCSCFGSSCYESLFLYSQCAPVSSCAGFALGCLLPQCLYTQCAPAFVPRVMSVILTCVSSCSGIGAQCHCASTISGLLWAPALSLRSGVHWPCVFTLGVLLLWFLVLWV